MSCTYWRFFRHWRMFLLTVSRFVTFDMHFMNKNDDYMKAAKPNGIDTTWIFDPTSQHGTIT